MTGFLLGAALLVAGALAFLLQPLLKRRPGAAPDARVDSSAAILGEQLAELDAERAQGLVSAERHAESRAEIERRLVEDLRAAPQAAPAPGPDAVRAPRAALALALGVPVAAIALYLLIGTPAALDPAARVPAPQAKHDVSQQDVEAMVAKLAARLELKPADAEGWFMLARSQRALGRYPEAVRAYEKLLALIPPDPDVLADYADALAMVAGGTLAGEPYRLLQQALALDPDHGKSLALAGTAEFERKNYKAAAAYWERLLPLLPPESEFTTNVRDGIADARSRAGLPMLALAPAAPAAVAGPEAILGTVSLDPALAAKVAPDDVVFVLARPVEGSRMPLAVARTQVRNLPYSFRLDDGMAMTPQARLSGQTQVVVAARISKSGNANVAAGDLEGESAPVAPGARDLRIVISTVRK
ncbi:MAG TPA: c-type cytochrome biogenesis protein CcmI [Burkholderiales bacterium]